MTTEFNDIISSGPVDDDDAMPSESALQQAMNRLLGDDRSTSAPAAPQSPAPESALRLRPGTTPTQVKSYIETLESHPAWTDKNHPEHAELHRRLRAAYTHLDATPDAPAPAARPTPHPQQVRSKAMTEARIKALEADSALMNRNDPRHDAVLGELRRAYQALHPEPAGELQELPPLSDALREAGLVRPTLPGPLADRLDEDALADFSVWSVQQGLGSQKAQAILGAWQQEMVLGGRAFTGPRPGDFERWGERLTTEFGLTKRQADQLLGWYRARLGEGA